jgi:hypothetical protein
MNPMSLYLNLALSRTRHIYRQNVDCTVARCTPRGAVHHPLGTGWFKGCSQAPLMKIRSKKYYETLPLKDSDTSLGMAKSDTIFNTVGLFWRWFVSYS